jgi:hypothetical protein
MDGGIKVALHAFIADFVVVVPVGGGCNHVNNAYIYELRAFQKISLRTADKAAFVRLMFTAPDVPLAGRTKKNIGSMPLYYNVNFTLRYSEQLPSAPEHHCRKIIKVRLVDGANCRHRFHDYVCSQVCYFIFAMFLVYSFTRKYCRWQ